jgi:glycosyltransferase involved in cell wall biosynthesis
VRVLILSKALIVGQYQTKLEELAKQPGLELTVVVPPFWRDERGTIPLERAHTQGYNFLVEPMRFNGQFHFHYYPTLPSILKRVRPHIVHIDEEPYNLATFLALRAAQSVGAKSLFFTWQNILRQYPPPFAWLESYVLRNTQYAIAGNAEAANVLQSKSYRGKISIIPQFGTDTEFFKPTSQLTNHPTNQPFQIGFAGGRLVEEKGIDLLLQAAAQLQGDWRVHILGGGPDKERLQTLAHTHGIESRVQFDASIPSSEMPDYLRALDVVVLPSLTRPNWKEQFGRILVEAMACEITVIGSSCGEIPNVIGDAGLVFPEGDVAALRMHLETLQNDFDKRRKLGILGRARVLAHFTQARIAQETYQVYREMMEQTNG